ncbi:MAG TPA: hypothetical protein VGL24_11370 [Chthoniobacterales bacterium]
MLNPRPIFSLLAKIGVSSCAVLTALLCVGQVSAAPGDLYVSDLASNSIVVYKPDGTPSTFASGLDSPQGLTFDQLGNLFVVDGGSGSVFKFSPDGLTKTTVATGLNSPVGVALNGFDVIVSENGGNQLTRIAPGGTTSVYPLAVTAPLGVTSASANQATSIYAAAANGTFKVGTDGTVTTIYSGADGRNVAVDADGNVFLSLGSGDVRKFPFGGGNPTTFASGLNDPYGMAFRPKKFSGDTDGVGNLFAADPTGGFIFQITPDGVKTTFASGGKPNFLVFEVGQVAPTPTPTPSPSPSVSPTPTPSPTATPVATPGLLRNISTRDDVLTGDNVLIGGFIVTGGTTDKTVVVRAIGPSLSGANPPVLGALANPVLELHMPDGSVITNDDWKDNSDLDQAALIASGLAPTNDLESAIIVTLPPEDPSVPGSGLYTAIVRGNSDTTGIGLMEVYDLDDPLTTTSQLANISTRGFVSTGDSVLIGGLISGPGTDDGKILVRAIGPSLTDAGVSGALMDPTLEVFNGDGDSIGFNDNWQDTARDEIIATGLAPTDTAESAMLFVQVAGSYTVIVRGVDDSMGIALVEAYHLPATTAK